MNHLLILPVPLPSRASRLRVSHSFQATIFEAVVLLRIPPSYQHFLTCLLIAPRPYRLPVGLAWARLRPSQKTVKRLLQRNCLVGFYAREGSFLLDWRARELSVASSFQQLTPTPNMNLDLQTQLEAQRKVQPLAPAVSMRWYFISVAALGVVIALAIRSGSVKLQILLGLLVCPVAIYLLCSSVCFLIAYLVGSLNQIVFYQAQRPESPFANETLPPQIIPPQARD